MSKDKLSLVAFEKDGKQYPAGIKESVFNGLDNGKSIYINYFIPAITTAAYNNLYGRMMTLVEATTEKSKLKSVKSLFQRELNEYFSQLEKSVEELDKDHIKGHGYYYKNVYVYGKNSSRIISDDNTDLEI